MRTIDPALEELSDKVRRGEPVSFFEAVAVADYQGRLKAERDAELRKTLLGRFRLWWRSRD